MRVIVAGSRTVRDIRFVFDTLDAVHKLSPITELVSGAQMSVDNDTGERYGADYLGEKWAEVHGVPIKKFPAEWQKYGKRAGFLRNTEMGEYTEALVAFWENQSNGTGHMIDIMKRLKKKVKICRM